MTNETKRIVIELRGFGNIMWLLIVMTAFAAGWALGSATNWWLELQWLMDPSPC